MCVTLPRNARPTIIAAVLLGCALLVFLAICFGDPISKHLLANTILLWLGTCAVSLPIGASTGFVLARIHAPGRAIFVSLMVGILFLPHYLYGVAWQSAAGPFSLLSNYYSTQDLLSGWFAAIWIHAMAAIPWVSLLIFMALIGTDTAAEEALLLDGGGSAILRYTVFPRLLVAVLMAAVLVLLITAGEMTVTDLYQVRTFAEEIYTLTAIERDLTQAAQRIWAGLLLLLFLACGGTLLVTAIHRTRRRRFSRPPLLFSGKTLTCSSSIWLSLVTVLTVGVPVLGLSYIAGRIPAPSHEGAFSWSPRRFLEAILAAPGWFQREIYWSALIAVLAAATASTAALMIAWWGHRSRWRAMAVLGGAASLWALPAPLLGLALVAVFYQTFDPFPYLNDYTVMAPVLGIAIRILPWPLFIYWYAFRQIPRDVLDAAALDGAGTWRQLFFLALPANWHFAVTGWFAALAAAFADLSISIILLPPGVSTLGTRIFDRLHTGTDQQVAAVCLLVMAFYVGLGQIVFRLAGFFSTSGKSFTTGRTTLGLENRPKNS